MADFPPATPVSRSAPPAGDRPALSPAETEQLTRAVMRKQAALSIRVAAVFLVIIFGIPLLNWKAPDFAATPVGGFTLTWLLLGILFYPVTWLLSGYFIRQSDKIESEIAAASARRGEVAR